MFQYGRINRATYWLGFDVLATIYAVLNLMSSKQVAVSEVALAVLSVPRLNNVGKSAWWAGAAFILEVAVVLTALTILPIRWALVTSSVFVIVLAGLLIWLGIIPGQPAANRYGEPPALGIWPFGCNKSPAV
jgi:uncharacterized membrane protein YhaH (DUF805 family)